MPKKKKEELDEQTIKNLKADLEAYHSLMANLQTVKILRKAPLRVAMSTLAKMNREEKRVLQREKINEACSADAYEDIDKLIGMTHRSYQQYKGLPDLKRNTHQFITDQASALLALRSDAVAALHATCTYPDEPKSDMSDLIFEGHFYGKTGSGNPGNFIDDAYPPKAISAMTFIKKVRFGADENIHEHAVMNFTKHFNRVLQDPGRDQKLFYLGVSAHYLQDLTAPHHAGNYPAFPYVDHYFFEQFASRYVYGDPRFKISRPAYKKFKAKMGSNPRQAQSYALEVTARATPFIQYIERDSCDRLAMSREGGRALDADIKLLNKSLMSGHNEKWEKAIIGAVPLAVYATAYLFETVLG